jgi:hypothetical protein
MRSQACLRFLAALLSLALAVASLPSPALASELVTFSYFGVIDKVVDQNRSAEPNNNVSFPPIPVGSTFSGSFSFDTSAPRTGGDSSTALYYDLGPQSRLNLVINDLVFQTFSPQPQNPFIQVHAPNPLFNHLSALTVGTQPITLPSGWSVPPGSDPYISINYFFQPSSDPFLLPTDARGIDLSKPNSVVLDFLQDRVTVAGVTYPGRIAAFGTMTLLVPEPSGLLLTALTVPALLLLKSRRR